MTAQIIDINAVRAAALMKCLPAYPPQVTRTQIIESTCLQCEGFGLLRVQHGKFVPVCLSFEESLKIPRESILICKPCAGVGKFYREVELVGEVG